MNARRSRTWSLSDLVCDHTTGKLRETALWSNIGKLTMTFGFIWMVIRGTPTEWLWATYGGVVVLHEASARFFNQRDRQITDREQQP